MRVSAGGRVDLHHIVETPIVKSEPELDGITVAAVAHHRQLRQLPRIAHLIEHVHGHRTTYHPLRELHQPRLHQLDLLWSHTTKQNQRPQPTSSRHATI
jgi:hypothetical protein